MDNRHIAQQLARRARYLADHHSSLYRVQAYRRAAETVLELEEPVENIVARDGRRGLTRLPGIGNHISKDIEALVQSGDLPPGRGASDAKPAGTSDLDSCEACGISLK